MGGEVWFSVLLHNPDDGSVCGLTFNPTGNADPNSDSVRHGVQLVGNRLRVVLAGGATSPVATLALDQTHLLLGRMVLEGGPDTFELWADPDDLSDLGPADFAEDGVDFFDLLSKVAVFGYNPEGPFNQPWRTNGGYIDALRLSNREGMGVAFRDVTGVPEPGALVMLTLAIPAVVRRRSRRGCPSRRARRRRG